MANTRKVSVLRRNDTFIFFEADGFERMLGERKLSDVKYQFPEFQDMEDGSKGVADIEIERLKAHGIGHQKVVNTGIKKTGRKKGRR